MKYKYQVILDIEVEAFDASDAFEAVQNNFALGDMFGVDVVECVYLDKNNSAKKKK